MKVMRSTTYFNAITTMTGSTWTPWHTKGVIHSGAPILVRLEFSLTGAGFPPLGAAIDGHPQGGAMLTPFKVQVHYHDGEAVVTKNLVFGLDGGSVEFYIGEGYSTCAIRAAGIGGYGAEQIKMVTTSFAEPFEIERDFENDSNYLEYATDREGNIVDQDGNLLDYQGDIVEFSDTENEVNLPADWNRSLLEQLRTGESPASPLILDLDGDGVELGATVYWDIDQDGMAEATSWVSGGDGLLAYDRSGDGTIDSHSELFGTEVDDGFLALSEFDSNSDGVINASDTAFDDLIVWVDLYSDGVSQAYEMYSLIDLGITEIDLNASAVDYEIEGNTISSESTFTMNGQERTIVDAWFNYDDMNSVLVQTVAANDNTLDLRKAA